MSSVNNQQVQGGHLVKINVGGQEVGFGISSGKSQDYGLDAVYAIGSIGPLEHVPLRWSGQVTLAQFFLNKNALNNSAVHLAEMVPIGPDETLNQTSFDMTVLGKDDEEVMTFEECTPANFNIEFNANQFTRQNSSFQAKRMRRGTTTTHRGGIAGDIGTESSLQQV